MNGWHKATRIDKIKQRMDEMYVGMKMAKRLAEIETLVVKILKEHHLIEVPGEGTQPDEIHVPADVLANVRLIYACRGGSLEQKLVAIHYGGKPIWEGWL